MALLARRGRRNPSASTAITRVEAFRVLRSNLLVAIAELHNPVVLVTSPNPGEGKSSTAVALAASLAGAGRRVVLVDLDLRDPDGHNYLGIAPGVGASDVLLNRASLEDALEFVEQPEGNGFYFLQAGSAVTNPTEVLSASRTGPLLTALASRAEIVLVDTAPVLPVADTLVLGRLAAGALLVIEAGRTATPVALNAKDSLTRHQVRILGVVLNKVQDRDVPFGYGYGSYDEAVAADPDAATANGGPAVR